jgi:hypothetical protein
LTVGGTARQQYSAWIREKTGKAEEMIELPSDILTVADLVAENARTKYAEAFRNAEVDTSVKTEGVPLERPPHHDTIMKLDGTVSKRRDAPYPSGKQCGWVKIKCANVVVEDFAMDGGAQDRQGAWNYRSANHLGPRGRGNRVKRCLGRARLLSPVVVPVVGLVKSTARKIGFGEVGVSVALGAIGGARRDVHASPAQRSRMVLP